MHSYVPRTLSPDYRIVSACLRLCRCASNRTHGVTCHLRACDGGISSALGTVSSCDGGISSALSRLTALHSYRLIYSNRIIRVINLICLINTCCLDVLTTFNRCISMSCIGDPAQQSNCCSS